MGIPSHARPVYFTTRIRGGLLPFRSGLLKPLGRRLLLWVGTSSPSNLPQGFSSGILSKTIFSIPIKGMERNMTDNPHTAPPSNTARIDMRALILTLDDTI